MGLAFLPLAVVMIEIDAPWPSWCWIIFAGVLWPHVAYLAAIRSRDPFRAELRNFVIDSIMAGSWAPLMHFNVLPSALLLTVVTADKVNSGIRKLWLHSLPGVAIAMLVVAFFTGFAWPGPSLNFFGGISFGQAGTACGNELARANNSARRGERATLVLIHSS